MNVLIIRTSRTKINFFTKMSYFQMNSLTKINSLLKWMRILKRTVYHNQHFRIRTMRIEIPQLRYEIASYIYQWNVSFPSCVSKTMPKCGSIIRSSLPEVLCNKGVLRNFAKFTGNHLCQSLFFNKVAGLGPATRDPGTPFHRGHLLWLLLSHSRLSLYSC